MDIVVKTLFKKLDVIKVKGKEEKNKIYKAMKDFLNSVRMPYQDAIVFATDYMIFILNSLKDLKNKKDFHLKQAYRMKDWITDMKEFIVSNESCHEREA